MSSREAAADCVDEKGRPIGVRPGTTGAAAALLVSGEHAGTAGTARREQIKELKHTIYIHKKIRRTIDR